MCGLYRQKASVLKKLLGENLFCKKGFPPNPLSKKLVKSMHSQRLKSQFL